MKLYREEILEHYKNPKNFGLIADPDFSSGEHNPSCGDSIAITGTIKDGAIDEIGFEGKGCALSIAMASKLTEFVLKKKISEISLEDSLILQLLGIALGPNRMMCGQLPINALKNALDKAKG